MGKSFGYRIVVVEPLVGTHPQTAVLIKAYRMHQIVGERAFVARVMPEDLKRIAIKPV